MAILAIIEGNMSTTQYEAVRREVDWEGNQPEGVVFHAAGFDESDRIHIADIWESPANMNDFAEHRLMPAFKKLGIAPPDTVIYPAHNINAYKSIEKHRI